MPEPHARGPTGQTHIILALCVESASEHWQTRPRAMREATDSLEELLRGHAGGATTATGDPETYVAVFERATRAVDAALDLQRAIDALPGIDGLRLQAGIGIHAGDGAGEMARCAAIAKLAAGGSVLLSVAAAALVRDQPLRGATLRELGPHPLGTPMRAERLFGLVHPSLRPPLPSRTASVRPHNLPSELTALVGRASELAALRDLITSGARLITLTGPGGVGKTRLALRAAAELVDAYEDGAWFVPLAPVPDAALVPSVIAHTLGIAETTYPLKTLRVALAAGRRLLVIDNFEHLLDAAGVVVDLLGAAPGVVVVATSRERLGVAGEHVLPVPTLDSAEATSLFVERARAGRSGFHLGAGDEALVEELCRRLDGLPLAIELAAARSRALHPKALLERLDQRFRLLTGGGRDAPERHRTLEAAISWSYELLGDPEQALFRSLSVFAGGATLDAVQAVCGDDVIDELSSLVDRSLVRLDGNRYTMLETIAAFSAQRLEENGGGAEMRRRHAGWCLALTRRESESSLGWLRRLDEEHDNTRAALDWASRNDPGTEIRLAVALEEFWSARGFATEGRARLRSAIDRSPEDEPLRVRAFVALAGLALKQGDHDEATALCEQTLTRAEGDARLEARIRVILGSVAWARGRSSEAGVHNERAYALAREAGDDEIVGSALVGLANARYFEGDEPSARRHLEDALGLARRTRDTRQVGNILGNLGTMMAARGELAAAAPLYEEALALAREVGDPQRVAHVLDNLGVLAGQRGENTTARELYSEAMAIARRNGDRKKMVQVMLGVASLRGSDADGLLTQALSDARDMGETVLVVDALAVRGNVAYGRGDAAQAAAAYSESLAVARESGDVRGVARGLAGLGAAVLAQRDAARAAPVLGECLSLADDLGDRYLRALALHFQGELAAIEGDLRGAEVRLREGLAEREPSDCPGISDSLESLGTLAASSGKHTRAARLLGAAEALREQMGTELAVPLRARHQGARGALTAALGNGLDETWASGRALCMEEAVAEALEAAVAEAGPRFVREADYWSITYDGATVRLPGGKGLQCLAVLLSDPGREFHAPDLAARVGVAGAGAERARVNVTRLVRSAIASIAEHHPALGRHLQGSVRTGIFCVYDPETPVRWEL